MHNITYRIHPALGVARVGNSPESFYLEPTQIGGLPTEIDPITKKEVPVTQFKHAGQVRRQAARFRVYREEEGKAPEEVTAGKGLKSVKWTVHVANKKAAWYNFAELQGDVMLGANNTYEEQGITLRNASETNRQALIIDPGPRTLSKPGECVEFDAASAPSGYHSTFPPSNTTPYAVTTLGSAMVSDNGALLVLGGLGNAGGPPGSNIQGFGGADGWYDDVADGPVIAEVETDDGTVLKMHAWVVSGAPKLAPELNNIASLSDTFIDVGVRSMELCPALYTKDKGFNSDYIACLERDVLPIIKAMKEYRWVANVDAMVSFATPGFDFKDLSVDVAIRQKWFSMLRDPGQGRYAPEKAPQHQVLMAENGFPLMPLNSGDNSISNNLIEKFMALTPTQYALLKQWSIGKCESMTKCATVGRDWPWVNAIDHACAGNVVGEPMAPGIEVTWTMRNPDILTPGDPFRVALKDDFVGGPLSPSRDETTDPAVRGCEPGDLTKRMAIPWQADFYDCTQQQVNFTTPSSNKTISNLAKIPLAPTFYAYWWPAQSPYNVYAGATTAQAQALDGGSAVGLQLGGQVFGQNVLYHRGFNSFGDAVQGWKYLGFILNRTQGELREMLPFYVEEERNYEAFGVGYLGVLSDGSVEVTQPVTLRTAAEMINADSVQSTYPPIQWLNGN